MLATAIDSRNVTHFTFETPDFRAIFYLMQFV